MYVCFTVRCKPTQDYEYPGDVGEDNADWGGNESNDNYVDEDTSSIDPKTGPPPRLYTKSLKLLARLGDDVRLPCNVTNTGSSYCFFFFLSSILYGFVIT